jgi:DNA topoisomerase-1
VSELPVGPGPASPAEDARNAGLRYVSVSPLGKGIARKKSGKGFRYLDADGKTVRDQETLRRIRALAIPPAWTDVWICPSPLGHIQAVGRDARGRRQYRYHARWREVRDETKYGQLAAFGHALPAIRRRVRADLAKAGMPREKVIATIVELLDQTMMRVGNEEYARQNDSYGLTTLRSRHARFPAGVLELRFRGKSGKEHRVRVEDKRIARIVRTLQDLPGQELFQYPDEDGTLTSIDSTDVNAYLREIGGDDISAKVFRTWAGTVRALAALRAIVGAPAKEGEGEPTKAETARTLVEVVKGVAANLGNTPAVARKGYIHPGVLESFQRGALGETLAAIAARKRGGHTRGLDADERLTLAFLAEWQRRQKRASSVAAALERSLRRAARGEPRRRRAARLDAASSQR